MNRSSLLQVAAIVILSAVTSVAQKPSPTPKSDEDDVVRISTSLVQVDVLVTDKDGRQITDLKAEDFELTQDGKVQKISKFNYVSTPASRPTAASQTIIAPGPSSASANGGGRIVTFIVDDGNCASSQIGMIATREALERFVNDQMLPGDRVAIYQTRSGSSMLQQYTSDKTRVLQTARRIRWYPPSGSCSSPDGSFFERARSNTIDKLGPDGGITSRPVESEADRRRRELNEDFNARNQTVGTIGVLDYVVRGLEQLPGRKMVFFLSDGIPIRDRIGTANTAIEVMRELTDRANRNSVVFNTINVRGAFDAGYIDARDEVTVRNVIDSGRPSGTSEVVENRQRDARLAEEGLFLVANETGGNYYRGKNNLDGFIDEGLRLEQGYYLLGYEPDDETFRGKKFHKIDVKVRRSDVSVASRSGFLAKPDVETPVKLKTADSELYRAIAAPLPKAGLDLRLTAFFGNGAEGDFIRSFVAVRGADITFVDDTNGSKKAVFDVVAVTMDDKNRVVDEFNKTHSIKVDQRTADAIKSKGLVYSADVPVKKPGTYNLRVAIRDASSRSLGSAGQTILIPELKKDNFVMSGLSIGELDAEGKFARPSRDKLENGFSLTTSAGGPATRQFVRPTSAAYSYSVYNAGTDASALTIEVNLYKDGKIVSDGSPKQITSKTQNGRLDDFGLLRITEAVTEGEYTLEVIVRNPAKKESSSQTVDFEVVR